jgi:Fe-S-cluster containining protein
LMFLQHDIKKLLQNSVHQLQELKETYALLPSTRCRRKTNCCSMLPEMSLVEALAVINRLLNMPSAKRRQFVQNIVNYFFLNPVEITLCPFLEGQDCLIYEHRFFGCRAYGLWSQEYYEKLSAVVRQAKIHLREQWKNLGLSLPSKVVNFQVPYCTYVEIDGHAFIDDRVLLNISDTIEAISVRISQRHQSFSRIYFSDLSFLLSSLVFGFAESIQMKFAVVRDIITTGNMNGLEKIIDELPDLCAKLDLFPMV